VLVVDDEEGILRAVGRALVINGYDVETAADGKAAVHSLAARAPDVASSLLTTSRAKHA
jgi:DNA-binding response OmpR family regulator